MTTTAVFPFDVAARDCMRSYHLSGCRDCADGTRPPSFGNSKRNWGRRAGVAATTLAIVPLRCRARDSATNPGRSRGARSSWGRRRRCVWFERRRLPGRAWHRCFRATRDRSAHQARSVRLTFGPKPFDAACKKTERRSCAVELLQPCSVISAIFWQEATMNGIIYLIGLIVVILAILSFFGLR